MPKPKQNHNVTNNNPKLQNQDEKIHPTLEQTSKQINRSLSTLKKFSNFEFDRTVVENEYGQHVTKDFHGFDHVPDSTFLHDLDLFCDVQCEEEQKMYIFSFWPIAFNRVQGG